MPTPFAYLTDVINSMGNSPLYWIVGGLLALLVLLWLIHRIVKSAVRSAIKEAGLLASQPDMARRRRSQDPKYDFVYTEPRSEQ